MCIIHIHAVEIRCGGAGNLDYCCDKDKVEKIFDAVKNEMNGNKLRVHSAYNTDGRLFIKFIALIIYIQ
jgi:transposase